MSVQIFNYNNSNPVSFYNGMVNATEMAKAFGKRPVDYLKTKSAKAYVSFLNSQSDDIHSEHNTLSIDVLRVVNGGKHNGTWMCEDLALDFAQWLSLDFRHWVNLRIKELLKTGKTQLNNERQDFNMPKTYLEALKSLVVVEEEKEILRIQAIQDKPKVEFFDAVTGSKDAKPFGDIAKVLGYKKVGRNKLFSILRKEGILMDKNIPYQKYIDLGYFKLIETKFQKPDGTTCINIKTLILQKGVNYIMKKLNSLGYEKIAN
jgi:phage antirepressor YoqD-like protein